MNSAPAIKDWNIIAFKPAAEDGFVTEYARIKIDPQKSWFTPLENKNKPHLLGIKLYVDDFGQSRKKEFLTAAYIVLDSLLGEKSNALNLLQIPPKIQRVKV